jgi:hypothetical protein
MSTPKPALSPREVELRCRARSLGYVLHISMTARHTDLPALQLFATTNRLQPAATFRSVGDALRWLSQQTEPANA